MGTLAGNLSIKYQHNDFPSDIFLIFETVGASMTLVDSTYKKTVVSILDFLNTDINHQVILNIKLVRLDPSVYSFKSYKVYSKND